MDKDLFSPSIHTIMSVCCPRSRDDLTPEISPQDAPILSGKMSYRCQCLAGPRTGVNGLFPMGK